MGYAYARGMADWFDELELRPTANAVSMGTHAIGERPWLIADERRDAELAEKRWSLANRRDEVAWLTDASIPAAERVVELFADDGVVVDVDAAEHQLECAAVAVQDDLVLLENRDGVWYHDASVVCFPTHWHLPSKVDRPVTEVHAPVNGYAERIDARVTRLFDWLDANPQNPNPVWRRNFGLTETRDLFQPSYRDGDPNVDADSVLDGLFVRSERQTLRRLIDGWILFTIRIQVASIGELVQSRQQAEVLASWVREVPTELGRQRHLGDAQRPALLAALATLSFA